MRYALHVPNLAEPAELVEIGLAAETAGWDGIFLWDHVFGGPGFPVPVADPWVVLGALAKGTERIALGTAVTPPARRRPHKLARETVSVDHLSNGRLILGVGLGSPRQYEYGAFGEAVETAEIASRFDEALEVLTRLWSGEVVDHRGPHFTVHSAQFLPAPIQTPRIPIWAASQIPRRAPLVRAARWDGVILADMNDQGGIDPVAADDVATAVGEIEKRRTETDTFDVAVVADGLPAEGLTEIYSDLGVTWVLVTGWLEALHELAASGPT